LEFKFGVTNGLTIRNSSGEIEDGNYSSNEIADIFSNIGRVMRCLMDRIKQFDMQDAIMIPKLVDKTLSANSGKWAAPTTDMLKDVKTLTLDAVKEYTSDTLKFDKTYGTGRQDQHWLLKLIRNSCSSDLRDIVDKTFNELPVHQQGGSVYLKLIYDVVFNMTEPVICVLQNWIKGFATRSQARMSAVCMMLPGILLSVSMKLMLCLQMQQWISTRVLPKQPMTISLVLSSFLKISVIKP
jgi:hypothetical protein